MVSQKDIAAHLNISRVTVTKALLDHPDISQDTKTKVKQLAQQLGYLPNRVGRSLSTQKTNTIGVVVPKIAHSFFSEAIEIMYRKAASLGYQLILTVSFENAGQEYQNVETLLSMHVDGLIIDSASGEPHTGLYNLLKKREVPYMFFDRKPTQLAKVNAVLIDDYEMAYEAVNFLASRGYKKIAFIAGPLDLNICDERLKGFKAAMQEHQLEIKQEWLINSKLTDEDGYVQFKNFISKVSGLPEAVLCTNDSMAHGVYRAAAEHSLSIPEDLGVIGFGDLSLSSALLPPLTSIKFPIREMCHVAVEGLVSLIESKVYTKQEHHFHGNLIVRKSTR